MNAAEGEDIPSCIVQKQVLTEGTKASGFLHNALKNNLLSLQGRRDNIGDMLDMFSNIVPTSIADAVDFVLNDENGDDVPVLKDGVFAGQHFDSIRERLLEKNELFVDPWFPPIASSLFVDELDEEFIENSDEIEWKRASVLSAELDQKPRFFVEGAMRFDINQGELGNCWFLAAIGNLTMHEKLFKKVVPIDQGFGDNYAGIFHFRFWQYGEWIDIVIDDYLPTKEGKLLFVRSNNSNEFWSALLEKAYAKLYGSYQALDGGLANEALVDFSGGCTEEYDLTKTQLSPQDIFDLMLRSQSKGSLMCCSTSGDDEAEPKKGIVGGHAYSITKVLMATVPLIRIRNPWGDEVEWEGQWSDACRKWQFISDEDKEAFGIVDEDDGEFFMTPADFVKHFESIEICHLGPDGASDDHLPWHESRFHGTWLYGSSAGGCSNYKDTFATNPQFLFRLTDSDDDDDDLCTCVIALMQKGSRRRSEGCLFIGFEVYRLESEDQLPLDKFFFYDNACSAESSFTNVREVVARFKLEPGLYVIIPSTFDPDEESDFLLRIFSEKGAECYQA